MLKYLIAFGLIQLTSAAQALVTVMHYNVENLFDTNHDEGKQDWTFLPFDSEFHSERLKYCDTILVEAFKRDCLKIDWTPAKLDQKLNQIKQVYQIAKKVEVIDGKTFETYPQILTAVEIENSNVAKMLADRLGFKNYLITNSPDERGIDVALFYNENENLKFVNYETLRVSDLQGVGKTRDILIAQFELTSKSKLYISVNHWPSQSAPAPVRVAVAEALRWKLQKIHQENPDAKFMVVGDFNVTEADRPDPFFDGLLKEPIGESKLLDLDQLARKIDPLNKTLPLGTYFYSNDMKWNMLDKFYVSSNFLPQEAAASTDDQAPLLPAQEFVQPATYRIHNDFQFATEFVYKEERAWNGLAGSIIQGVPWRFDHQGINGRVYGYSDHFAISVEIK
jgi:hypothetical protein